MPPHIPETLLKCFLLISSPPRRHHHYPSPFIYANKSHKPSLTIAGPARRSAESKLSDGIRASNGPFLSASSQGGKGWRRWWTAERRWPQRIHTVGALQHQYRRGDGEADGGDAVNKQKQEEEHETRQGLLTLPTVLTLARLTAVPILVSTFYMNNSWATTATTGIFLAAAITDWLDGYIARKMRSGTAFGAFLDPVADKLMVATTLILLCTRPFEVAIFGEIPWLLSVPSIVIIGREITMSAVREWAASQNSRILEAVAVNKLGKWKTATQMVSLTILLITRDSSLTGSSGIGASGVVLLYISAGLAVWSLIVYIWKIWKFLI